MAPTKNKKETAAKTKGSLARIATPSGGWSSKVTKSRKPVTPKGSPKKSALMALPPELRNYIYELALLSVPNEPFDHPSKRRHTHHTPLEPGLLLVSKQVRAETIKMHYIQNAGRPIHLRTFHLTGLADWLPKIVERIGVEAVENLSLTLVHSTWATFHQVVPVVELLYKTGIQLGQKNRWGLTALLACNHSCYQNWHSSSRRTASSPAWFRVAERHQFQRVFWHQDEISGWSILAHAIENAMRIGFLAAKESWTPKEFKGRLALFLRVVYSDDLVTSCIKKSDAEAKKKWKNWFETNEYLCKTPAYSGEVKYGKVKDKMGMADWMETIMDKVCRENIKE